jgi:hypothetical protein
VPTATQIIEQALGELGSKAIGQVVSGPELLDCFDRLNALVDAWRGQGLYAVAHTTVTATLLAGVPAATIGLAQTFAVDAPFQLVNGSSFRSNGVDFPIRVATFAEYQSITLKSQVGIGPELVLLNSGFPVGTLNFWPVPQTSVQVSLAIASRITQFTDLTTNYTFAPGYQRALFLTLAEELAAPYQTELSATTVRNATAARRIVKRMNAEIPMLTLDSRLPGFGTTTAQRRGIL